MATQAVSAHSLFPNLELQPVDIRQQVHAEAGEGMMATIARVAPLVLGLLAAVAGGVLFGPPGILLGVGVALATFLLSQACSCISNCFADRHAHGNDQPARPWYHHVINWIPVSEGSVYFPPAQNTGYLPPSGPLGHVGVGAGHFRQSVGMFGTPPPSGPHGHAPVGRGHLPPPAMHGPGIPPLSAPPPSGGSGHVPVRSGHYEAPPTQSRGHVPPPSGPTGHTTVGGGHFTPPSGYGGGHLPFTPPSGPTGHAPVGGGHFTPPPAHSGGHALPPTGPAGHTAVGGGHFTPPPPQHPPSGPGGHVGVGSRRHH